MELLEPVRVQEYQDGTCIYVVCKIQILKLTICDYGRKIKVLVLQPLIKEILSTYNIIIIAVTISHTK